MDIFINGRFLTQSLTGVQRYAAEMVKAIDRLLASGDAPRSLLEAHWQLLTPAGAVASLKLERIGTRQFGSRSGHLWDQLDLARAANGGILISLANSGPVLHPDHLIVIHDAQVFRRPDFFSWAYRTTHRALGYLLARRATIASVSAFSRCELSDVLRLTPAKVPIFPNSAEHFAAIIPDYNILARLGLSDGKFFLSVGAMSRNKNISLAIDAAELLKRPDFPLVVVGGDNNKVFQGNRATSNASVVMAGRLSDQEVAALYARAAAFVFPSLYEGFGVPPLEAMIFGCPVIATKAEAVRETCGDAATFFDPLDAEQLCNLMLQRISLGGISDEERQKQSLRLAEYSWRNSAAAMLGFLNRRPDANSTSHHTLA